MKQNRTKYINDYKKEHVKRVPFEVSKDKYDEIKEHAANNKETVNGFIKRAIDETIERDNNKWLERLNAILLYFNALNR